MSKFVLISVVISVLYGIQGSFIFTISFQENIYQSVTYQKNIQDLQWHHVVVTIEAGSIIYHMDGNQVATR